MALRYCASGICLVGKRSVLPLLNCNGLHSSSALSGLSPGLEGLPVDVWKLGKLNHVAIAVSDIDKATALYRDVLGAQVSEKHAQPDHGVYTVFVQLGETKIELLYPLGKNSPIQNFLDKNKAGGMHHICLEVSDLKAAIKTLRSHKIRTLGDEPKIGAHGKPVIFVHPKDCCGTLVELEQA